MASTMGADMTTQHPATQFHRAAQLDAAGQTEAARAAYLAILTQAPDHAATLNNFGALLCRTGYRTAGRTAFAQAASCHPGDAAGHVNLANLLREDGALDQARHHYEAALACAPNCAEAHQGLGNVFADLGDARQAAWHRQLGWQDRVFTPWRYRGTGTPLRVLLLTSVGGGNVPVKAFLDDDAFAVTSVATEYLTPGMTLPPHDVVLNAIGDADSCADALRAACHLPSAAPMLNPPAAVAATGRLENARRLRRGPGVRTPRMACLPRAMLDCVMLTSLGFSFPLLLRAPGFHTGQHFVRVDTPADLAPAVAAMPGDSLLAIEILPALGPDGMARKYRVMIVGRQLYPLHLAISADWKVHYFTAAMARNAAFRAEEHAFLTDMPGTLGKRACAALAWIAGTLGLDYGGIDFALDADGTVLLFEANATMALVPPPQEPIWDYRRPAFNAVTNAARALVATI
jgi:hypothetical protein